MKPVFQVLTIATVAALSYEGIIQASEFMERHNYYSLARAYCDGIGKPLLRVGMRRSILEPPNGDITIDIDRKVLEIPGGVCGDERDMPFDDKLFGVSFNQHTLEHLRTADDVELAIAECRRVADFAVLLAPSPNSIYASLFNPTHNLRLWLDQARNQVIVRPNNWRTGLGLAFIIRGILLVRAKRSPNRWLLTNRCRCRR